MWYLPNLSYFHCFCVNTGKCCPRSTFSKKTHPWSIISKASHVHQQKQICSLCVFVCNLMPVIGDVCTSFHSAELRRVKEMSWIAPARVSCPVFLWGAVSCCPAVLPPETSGTSAPAAPLPIHWKRKTWWPHLTLFQIWRTKQDN